MAQAEVLNEENDGWNPTSFWGNLVEGEFRSCTVCEGEDGYEWDYEAPEVCTCDEWDGIDDEGRLLITKRAMKSLRRQIW